MNQKTKNQKVLVAMSGGVDSSVAVKLLQDQGYDVSGATMSLLPGDGERVQKAKELADTLGIVFYVFDLKDEFKREVIDSFSKSYIEGKTPNPCVECNKKFKFGRFYEKAMEMGFDYIATGHYARIEKDRIFHLKKSADLKKDQSYFLFNLNQEIMAHVIFPLDGVQKEKVREIAKSIGLSNALDKDSQDICFVPNGCYTDIIDNYYKEKGLTRPCGNFVDINGKILGTHLGIERYTIGQRKGVGMALGGENPKYVVGKDPTTHSVIMGENEMLFTSALEIKNPHFVGEELPSGKIQLMVKTRSTQKEVPAEVSYDKENSLLEVEFLTPIRAITKGQYAVFYKDDEVILGGEI